MVNNFNQIFLCFFFLIFNYFYLFLFIFVVVGVVTMVLLLWIFCFCVTDAFDYNNIDDVAFKTDWLTDAVDADADAWMLACTVVWKQ